MKTWEAFNLMSFLVLVSCNPFGDQAGSFLPNDHKVAVYYVIPTDNEADINKERFIRQSTLETQAWLQAYTVGHTFDLLWPEEVVQIYYAREDREFYQDDWWNKLINEMRDAGLPVQQEGTIVSLWVEGVQSIEEDVTVGLGATGCDRNCGASLVGIPFLIAGASQVRKVTNAHELGHAFGLKHPIEASDLPVVGEDSLKLLSIMTQTSIRESIQYQVIGLLPEEIEQLLKSPFIKSRIELPEQTFGRLNVLQEVDDENEIDLDFSYQVSRDTLKLTPQSGSDPLSYYWTFGDGSYSTHPSPQHRYERQGFFPVTLRVRLEDSHLTSITKFISIN